MDNKRFDIQGLRAIAIISVLIFHVWPSMLPFGFLGVDIFFVISGFLMAFLWVRNKSTNIYVFKQFYFRRIKRIVPIYLIIVVGVYLIGRYTLFESDQVSLRRRALWSLVFLSNFKLFEEQDYFVQQDEVNFFLHTWSLAVEIQFYLFVPLILAILMRFRKELRILVLVNLIALDAFFYMKVPENKSFGMLQYRIWQFLVGMTAFFIGDLLFSHKEGSNGKAHGEKEAFLEKEMEKKIMHSGFGKLAVILNVIKNLISISVTCILIAELAVLTYFSAPVLRLIVTFTTGLVLVIGFISQNFLLSHKQMQYIGDISYVLYLVHWPILTFVRYYSMRSTFDFKDGLLIIILSYATASFINKHVENRIIRCKLNLDVIGGITLISTMLIFGLIYMNPWLPFMRTQSKIDLPHEYMKSTQNPDGYVQYLYPEFLGNETYQRLIEKYPMLPEVNKPRECLNFSVDVLKKYDWNYICENRGPGSLNVLVIGNSFAHAHYDGIKVALEGKYSTIRLFCHNGAVPFGCSPDRHLTNVVQPGQLALVRMLKPDFVFIIVHYYKGFIEPIRDINNDKCINAANGILANLSAYAKAIILPDEPLNWNFQISYEMSKRLSKRMPIEDMKILEKTHKKSNEHLIRRLDKLQCPNCYKLQWNKILCNDGICRPYDEELGLPLYRNIDHINRLGVTKIFPHTKEVIDRALKKMSYNFTK